MDSFSLLYEVPLEIRNLIFSFTDEVTRFVLRFVNKDLREQYPFDCSDPAPELFYFAGFLIECIKKGYFKLLVRDHASILLLLFSFSPMFLAMGCRGVGLVSYCIFGRQHGPEPWRREEF